MTAARVHDCGWLANRPCPSCRKELEAMAKLELAPLWSVDELQELVAAAIELLGSIPPTARGEGEPS